MRELSLMGKGKQERVQYDRGKKTHASIQHRIKESAKEQLLEEWRDEHTEDTQYPRRTRGLEKLIDR